MRLTDLIRFFGIKRPAKLLDFVVKGISCNSKNIKSGFVFVAIKGVKADGNEFIEEAIKNGAKAVIVESKSHKVSAQVYPEGTKLPNNVCFIKVKDMRKSVARLAAKFYGDPSSKIKVIGVTGTNGKTTVTYLIEALLKEEGVKPAVIGTINYRFGNKVIVSINTTPGPIELESLLSDIFKSGVKCAVMEVSSHALDQARTEGINFSSAIFTNLTQDHLDYHKTMKNYFKSKARLFKGLAADSFAVINNDDKYARELKSITCAKIVTYGIDNKSDFTASEIKFDCSGSEFLLSAPKWEKRVKTKLIGKHNIYNILAAVACVEKEGIDKNTITSVVEDFSLVPGRLERVNPAGRFSVFVDYAHTEDALMNVLKSLRNLSKNRIIVVFGCGGERDKTKRPKMGRVVSELSDYCVITNDNPRSEDPAKITRDIKRGITRNNFCVIHDRAEAIRKSLTLADSGDIVLIAGKGHENYQLLKNSAAHFDDRKVARQCLQSMNF
jgi:UDP-N-acetylmuramoyl-L-alanyl-D-glutamate--2,6-diaminopimelate ligase